MMGMLLSSSRRRTSSSRPGISCHGLLLTLMNHPHPGLFWQGYRGGLPSRGPLGSQSHRRRRTATFHTRGWSIGLSVGSTSSPLLTRLWLPNEWFVIKPHAIVHHTSLLIQFDANPMMFALTPVSSIDATILPRKDTVPVVVSLLPRPRVGIAIEESILALSVSMALGKLARIDGAIRKRVGPARTLPLIAHKWALVTTSVLPQLCAGTMALVMFKMANITIPIFEL
jgi:hypothetical protein